MLGRLRRPWPDHRAERTLGAVACLTALSIGLMIVFVAVRALPTFTHNGLSWLGGGGDVDAQIGRMVNTTANPSAAVYHLRAWPIIYGTLLTAGSAVVLGLAISLLAAIFIVELSPAPVRRVVVPVIRLLACVPSVIWGLIGVLVLVPFVDNHLISASEKASVQYVVQLDGTGLLVAVVVLTLMITPIMVALITDALSAVPASWREGAIALGAHPLRATLAVSVRAVRPAIAAAAALACARAMGEAVMLSMVSGSRSFSPKPVDGLVFLFEPLRTLAAAIVEDAEGVGAPALRSTVYAFALLLLFSAFVLSTASYLIKLPLRRYNAGVGR